MVTEITMGSEILYSHTAWAEDAEGTGFSLTEFDGAVYTGNYIDTSDTDSQDPARYTWTTVDESFEEDTSAYDDVITDILDQTDDLEGDIITTGEQIEGTQGTSDTGLGNPNELAGTNLGMSGWTASSGLVLSHQSEQVYLETDDPVDYLLVTCETEGANYLYFNAEHLREVLADDTADNAYTMSLDVRMSDLFEIGTVAVQDPDGQNRQILFDPIDNSPSEDLEDIDNTDIWMHHSSTADVINANDEPVAVSSQVLFFDLSDMPQDAVIAIANLKVEGGALATPWRMGNDEIEQMARQAMQMASDAENVALHYITDTTDGIVVHPEGDTTTGWSMRAALELIKSGVSYIKAWIDGVIPKVRIGIENAGHILIDHDSVDVNDGNTTIATFSGRKIELGKNSESSEIELCDARGRIRVDEDYGIGIHSEDSACLRSTIETEDEQDETYKDSRVYLDSLNEGMQNTMASISAVSRNAEGSYQSGDITMAEDAPGDYIVCDPQPDQETFEEDPSWFYILIDGEYIECEWGDEYDPNTTYYKLNGYDSGELFITQDRANDLDFASAAIRMGTSHGDPYIDISITQQLEEQMYDRPTSGSLGLALEDSGSGPMPIISAYGIPAIWLNGVEDRSWNTFYRAKRDDTGVSCAFGIGSGGINHGIWSDVLGAWMIYANETNVYLNANVALNASRLTSGTVPVARLPVLSKVVAFTSAAVTQAANSGTNTKITVTAQSGYDFVGVVGFTCTHNQAASCGAAWKSAATQATMATTNRSSSKWTDQKCTVYCLFIASNAF